MNCIRQLLMKYRKIVMYIFLGGCTTLVNIAIYTICTRIAALQVLESTIIAWILAVSFAYITNRTFVFESKCNKLFALLHEAASFFVCRLLTGGVDLLIMYIFVNQLAWNDIGIKWTSNIIIILFNYIMSKFVVFK